MYVHRLEELLETLKKSGFFAGHEVNFKQFYLFV